MYCTNYVVKSNDEVGKVSKIIFITTHNVKKKIDKLILLCKQLKEKILEMIFKIN